MLQFPWWQSECWYGIMFLFVYNLVWNCHIFLTVSLQFFFSRFIESVRIQMLWKISWKQILKFISYSWEMKVEPMKGNCDSWRKLYRTCSISERIGWKMFKISLVYARRWRVMCVTTDGLTCYWSIRVCCSYFRCKGCWFLVGPADYLILKSFILFRRIYLWSLLTVLIRKVNSL